MAFDKNTKWIRWVTYCYILPSAILYSHITCTCIRWGWSSAYQFMLISKLHLFLCFIVVCDIRVNVTLLQSANSNLDSHITWICVGQRWLSTKGTASRQVLTCLLVLAALSVFNIFFSSITHPILFVDTTMHIIHAFMGIMCLYGSPGVPFTKMV